jgi:hypothetical protein
MIERQTATIKAEPKLLKPKYVSPIKLEVKVSIAALITKLNNPNVKSVSGKDNNDRIGFTIIFKSDRIKLAISAIHKPAT